MKERKKELTFNKDKTAYDRKRKPINVALKEERAGAAGGEVDNEGCRMEE